MNVNSDKLVKDFWKNHHDFSNGVVIEKEKITEWISDAITLVVRRMNNDPLLDEDYASTASGRSRIIVTAVKVSPGQYEIEILVIDSYKSYTEYITDTNYAFRV